MNRKAVFKRSGSRHATSFLIPLLILMLIPVMHAGATTTPIVSDYSFYISLYGKELDDTVIYLTETDNLDPRVEHVDGRYYIAEMVGYVALADLMLSTFTGGTFTVTVERDGAKLHDSDPNVGIPYDLHLVTADTTITMDDDDGDDVENSVSLVETITNPSGARLIEKLFTIAVTLGESDVEAGVYNGTVTVVLEPK